MNCPQCQSSQTVKNGTRKGLQRYKCKDCGRQFFLTDNPPHRPPKGEKPMTSAERQRLWRKRKKKKNNP
jgi:transposase-like protein